MVFDITKYPLRLHYDIKRRNIELVERFGPFAKEIGVSDIAAAEQAIRNATTTAEGVLAQKAYRAARAAERLSIFIEQKPLGLAYGDVPILQRAARWSAPLRAVLNRFGDICERAVDRMTVVLSPEAKAMFESGVIPPLHVLPKPAAPSTATLMTLFRGPVKGLAVIALFIGAGVLLSRTWFDKRTTNGN